MDTDTAHDIDAPVPYIPSASMFDPPTVLPLTDAEMRQMFDYVNELHAAFVYVRDNGPTFMAQLMESNPMLKMFGKMMPGMSGQG